MLQKVEEMTNTTLNIIEKFKRPKNKSHEDETPKELTDLDKKLFSSQVQVKKLAKELRRLKDRFKGLEDDYDKKRFIENQLKDLNRQKLNL